MRSTRGGGPRLIRRRKSGAPVMAPLAPRSWWADLYLRHQLPALTAEEEAAARRLGEEGARRGIGTPPPRDRTALEAQAELGFTEPHQRVVLRAFEHAENQPRRQSLARLRCAFDDHDLDAAADIVSGWISAERVE